MASKNKNPYRDGSAYAKIFDFIRKANGIVTRQALLDAGFTVSDVTVVLSPRAEGSSTRGGDCRGNMSAAGHIYYFEKLAKVKGEPQRFRLRWRATELEKHVRPPKKEVASQKAKKGAKATKAVKGKKGKGKTVKAKAKKAKAVVEPVTPTVEPVAAPVAEAVATEAVATEAVATEAVATPAAVEPAAEATV